MRSRFRAAAAVASLSVALAGCSVLGIGGSDAANQPPAPTSAPEPTNGAPTQTPERVEPAPEPTKTPTPKDTAAAVSMPMPECTQIISLDQANQIMQVGNIEFYSQVNNSERLSMRPRMGPAAVAAIQSSPETISCTWAIPASDGFLFFDVVRLSPEVRDNFIAELRASVYVEGAVGDSPTFVHDDGAGSGTSFSIGPMQYAFVGDLMFHSTCAADAMPTVVSSLQAMAG